MVIRNGLDQTNRKVRKLVYLKFPSNARLSIALGTYPEKVSRTLLGYRFLTEAEAARWAKALGCSISDLASIMRKSKGVA